MVKGSYDFIGINYYTAIYAVDVPITNSSNISCFTDSLAILTPDCEGIPIGPRAASTWLYVYPRGFKKNYNNPTIHVTENGIDEFNNNTLSLKEALKDPMRIDYHYCHLWFLQRAIKDGVNVKSYFAWSLLDNMEWNSGYTVRFCIYFIDYEDGLKDILSILLFGSRISYESTSFT